MAQQAGHVLQAAFATVAADCVRISRLGGEIRRDGAVEYLVALPVWQILSGEAHQRAT